MRRVGILVPVVLVGALTVLMALASGCGGDTAERSATSAAAPTSTSIRTEKGVFVISEGQSTARLVWEEGEEKTIAFPYSGHVSDILLDSQGRILCIQSTGERQALGIMQEGSANRIVPITPSKRVIKLVEDGGDVWLWTEDGYSIPILRAGAPVEPKQQEEEGMRGWVLFRPAVEDQQTG